MKRLNMTGPWTEPKIPRRAFRGRHPCPERSGRSRCQADGIAGHGVARWVWEQYDHLIQSNTAQLPGGDAAVVRVNDAGKAVAICTDVTPRYVEADPFEGGKQAVAEVWRNLTAVGADPIAITDNLNFGNPEKPEIMGSFVKAVQGIGAACTALIFLSCRAMCPLYNETTARASCRPLP